jgi:hypothetical protein
MVQDGARTLRAAARSDGHFRSAAALLLLPHNPSYARRRCAARRLRWAPSNMHA